MKLIDEIGVVLVSTLGAWVVWPTVHSLAVWGGFIAQPDPYVENHRHAVPLLGGVLFCFPALSVLSIGAFHSPHLWSMVVGLSIVMALGALKDWQINVPVGLQFSIQSAAALLVVGRGCPLVANVECALCWVSAVMVGVIIINALNFFDVMDGAMGGVSLLGCLAVIIASPELLPQELRTCTLVLVGGLAAFLRVNLSKTKCFMGDLGSYGLGLLFFILLLHTSRSWADLLGRALLTIPLPLGDFVVVVATRLLRGISPFSGGAEHLPLRLQRRGLSPTACLVVLYSGSVLCMLGTYVFILLLQPDLR
jgi:UDP-N-acetylmuramyl pentapeptide phosphotransferase/UDP-N-acetylglucosamine-1-phosphate transferase